MFRAAATGTTTASMVLRLDLPPGLLWVAGAALVGLCLGSLVGMFLVRRRYDQRTQHHSEQHKGTKRSLEALRQEQLEDKLTNRRLRYLLAVHVGASALGDDDAYQDLCESLEQSERLTEEVETLRVQLADRNESLRIASVSIQEIRAQIEDTTALSPKSGSSSVGRLRQ